MKDVVLFVFSALVATNMLVIWLVVGDALRFRKVAMLLNFARGLESQPALSMAEVRRETDAKFHAYAVAYTKAKREGKTK